MITCDGSGLGRICVASESLDLLLVKRASPGNIENNLAEAMAIREADKVRTEVGKPEMIIYNDNKFAIGMSGVHNVKWIEYGQVFLAGLVLHKMRTREYGFKSGARKGKIVTPYNMELDYLISGDETSMPLHESQVVSYIMKTLGSGDLRHTVRSREDL